MLRHEFSSGRALSARHRGALLSLLWRERENPMFRGLDFGRGLPAFEPYLDRDYVLAFDGDVLVFACGLVPCGGGGAAEAGPMVTRASHRRRHVMRDAMRWAASCEMHGHGYRDYVRATAPSRDVAIVSALCCAGFRQCASNADGTCELWMPVGDGT